jgi:hypothetical protein
MSRDEFLDACRDFGRSSSEARNALQNMAAEIDGARLKAELEQTEWEASEPSIPTGDLPLLDDVQDGDEQTAFYRVRDTDRVVEVRHGALIGWHFRIIGAGRVDRPGTAAMNRRFMGSSVNAALMRRVCEFVRSLT